MGREETAEDLIDIALKSPGSNAACDALVSLLEKHPESAAVDYVCGSFGFALVDYPEMSRRVTDLLRRYPDTHGAGCMGW